MKYWLFSTFSNFRKTARETSDLFLNSLTHHYQKKVLLIGCLIFLISLALFTNLTSNGLINGDAALYEHQIERLDFSHITTHLAYFLFGTVFTRLLPGSTDHALNFMNCFFGSLSMSLIYFIAFTIYRKYIIAIISTLFLLLNYFFVINSLYAEVYIVQTFFFLLALQFWLSNKPIIAGISFAVSVLVTPSAIFAIPCLIILRPHKRTLFLFCTTLFVILAIALLPRLNDYLFGNRGLLDAARHPINLRNAVIKESYEAIFGLFLTIPFIITGIVKMVSQEKLRPLIIAIFSLWLVNFLFCERFSDVPVQLPLYALLSVIGAFGYQAAADNLSKKRNSNREIAFVWTFFGMALVIIAALVLALKIGKTPTQLSTTLPIIFIVVLVLYTAIFTVLMRVVKISKINHALTVLGILILFSIMNSAMLLTMIKTLNHDIVEYRSAVLETNEVAKSNYLAVGGWNRGMLFEHYVFHDHNTGYWKNSECLFGFWGESKKEEFIKEWQKSLAMRRDILLLEHYPDLISELKNAGYTIRPHRNISFATAQE